MSTYLPKNSLKSHEVEAKENVSGILNLTIEEENRNFRFNAAEKTEALDSEFSAIVRS